MPQEYQLVSPSIDKNTLQPDPSLGINFSWIKCDQKGTDIREQNFSQDFNTLCWIRPGWLREKAERRRGASPEDVERESLEPARAT